MGRSLLPYKWNISGRVWGRWMVVWISVYIWRISGETNTGGCFTTSYASSDSSSTMDSSVGGIL